MYAKYACQCLLPGHPDLETRSVICPGVRGAVFNAMGYASMKDLAGKGKVVIPTFADNIRASPAITQNAA
ncbi:hypothetical protein [Pseudomonas cavernicola]|uniref:hypothetical protein n=1 Tax=Pseudomonas cavernicola TaxID=2320866 RepID=UPI0011C49038|nr:hypothetical protein [Pseudomonas cavernicola]